MKLTAIKAIPAPNCRRCGWLSAAQSAPGGHTTLASRKAPRQASTPERNPMAVATRRPFPGFASGTNTALSPFGKTAKLPAERSSTAESFASERVDTRDALTDDQGMHVVRAFIRLHRFQIHEMPHDGIVVGDPVRAQYVTRHPRTLQRHPYVIPLRHGNVLGFHLACIL